MIRGDKYRGEVVRYSDGVGCSIWLPFKDNEASGLCFDFSYDDIDDLINILQTMKQTEPVDFVETNHGN